MRPRHAKPALMVNIYYTINILQPPIVGMEVFLLFKSSDFHMLIPPSSFVFPLNIAKIIVPPLNCSIFSFLFFCLSSG
jgi:hypothetical protein